MLLLLLFLFHSIWKLVKFLLWIYLFKVTVLCSIVSYGVILFWIKKNQVKKNTKIGNTILKTEQTTIV